MFLLFLFSAVLVAQTDSIDIIVQNMMKKQIIIGLSEAVVKKGETIVNKGHGLANVEHKGHKTISLSGSNIGFRADYTRFSDDNLSIIILTNTDEANPTVIAMALADHYFRK